MTVYSHFASKEGLFEAVIRDRTERVVGGLPGAEALDPMHPRKALLGARSAAWSRISSRP